MPFLPLVLIVATCARPPRLGVFRGMDQLSDVTLATSCRQKEARSPRTQGIGLQALKKVWPTKAQGIVVIYRVGAGGEARGGLFATIID